MDEQSVGKAADFLVEARQNGTRPESLPAGLQPTTVAAIHAIQDATVSRLKEPVGGWKVMPPKEGRDGVLRGVILQSRIFTSPARLKASLVPFLGIEQEIAFRFDRALPPRASDYSRAEIEAAVTAVMLIEIVDTRFENYKTAPEMDKFADFCSNGCAILGAPNPDWRKFDLSKLEAVLSFDGEIKHRGIGGHPTVDPLLGAIALANELRKTTGVAAGRVMTTGSCTGLINARPGQKIEAVFTGFGKVEVLLEA